jgi:PST family polysaccharide transporter
MPEDFGIVAMCSPVLAFTVLFQDLGLSQATIQKASITHDEVNCLFWINVAVAVLMAFAFIVAAPLVARFYGEPRAGLLTQALSLQIVLFGLAAQHQSLLSRRMEFQKLMIINVVSGGVGFLAAILTAMHERSYWAIFAGTLATATFSTVGVWYASKWRPTFPSWHKDAGQVLHFGAGLTGFNLINFFARNLDGILIGRFWGGAELGYYDRANKLLLFPLNQIMAPLSKVMIPALSRENNNPESYRRAYINTISIVLLLVLPGIAFATATSDVLIPVLLGRQWADSAEIFRALGFAGLLQALNNPAGWLFISQGRSTEFMRWGFISSATVVAAFIIGLPYGAIGVAIAYAVGEYIRTPLLWLYIGRKGPVKTTDIILATGPFILASHIALAMTWMTKHLWSEDPLVLLAGSAACCSMIYLAVVVIFSSGRGTLQEAVSTIASLISMRKRGS